MKLKIFNDKVPEEEVLYVKLSEEENGNITLSLCTEYGDIITRGNILILSTKLGIFRCADVNTTLNIPLDDYGRVVTN